MCIVDEVQYTICSHVCHKLVTLMSLFKASNSNFVTYLSHKPILKCFVVKYAYKELIQKGNTCSKDIGLHAHGP